MEFHIDITRKGVIYEENPMFTLTGSGIRNILFDARLRNPAQLPAQLTFSLLSINYSIASCLQIPKYLI